MLAPSILKVRLGPVGTGVLSVLTSSRRYAGSRFILSAGEMTGVACFPSLFRTSVLVAVQRLTE